MKTIELKIEGIKCEGCCNRIKNILNITKEINAYELSLETKTLKITFKKEATLKEVQEKIQNLGFKITEKIEK